MVDLGRIPDSASGVLQGQNRIISSLINFSTTIQRVSSQVETISKIIPNFINRAKIQHFATITRDLKAQTKDKVFDVVFCSDLKRAVKSAELTWKDTDSNRGKINRSRKHV
jgi:hypothetical protein